MIMEILEVPVIVVFILITKSYVVIYGKRFVLFTFSFPHALLFNVPIYMNFMCDNGSHLVSLLRDDLF